MCKSTEIFCIFIPYIFVLVCVSKLDVCLGVEFIHTSLNIYHNSRSRQRTALFLSSKYMTVSIIYWMAIICFAFTKFAYRPFLILNFENLHIDHLLTTELYNLGEILENFRPETCDGSGTNVIIISDGLYTY